MSRLTDYQWLILWELADSPGRFWRREDDWMITGTHRDHKVTLQIEKLMGMGLIAESPDAENLLYVKAEGLRHLQLRDYMDVLNRQNSK